MIPENDRCICVGQHTAVIFYDSMADEWSDLFAAPDMAAEGFEITAAAEIMGLAGYKIIGQTIAGIEMSGKGLLIGIDGYEYTLTVIISLNNALFIGEHGNFDITIAQRFAFLVRIGQTADMFGQFIGATLVTLILLFNSPLAAVIFAIVYIIYAQIENNIIAPKIQGSALNLPAVAILVAIVIGMYMFGLLGAIIAVPIAGCIRVLIDEYPNIRAAGKD